MKKRQPDKEDTQEIKIPKYKTDYGDNFETASYEENTERKEKEPFLKKFTKRQIITVTSIISVIFITGIVIIIVSLSQNSAENLQDTYSSTNSSTSFSTHTPTTSNSEYVKKVTEQATIEETTIIETTEPTTIAPTTEIAETTIEKNTEAITEIETTQETEEVPSKEKYLSVSDILVLKTDDGLFIPKITGIFDGYSPEELLKEVTVSVSSGKPKLSLPLIENNNSFTFNLDLKGCKGELHIHIDNYDFYQDIDSFPKT